MLLVHHPARSALLTEDIEKRIERQLLEKQANLLFVDVLIARHHGSKFSSTCAFIHATSPD
ncbi:MAG: hypothetical protein P8X88_09920 [Gammaproteobacteria bacterium]